LKQRKELSFNSGEACRVYALAHGFAVMKRLKSRSIKGVKH
jgi:hypothetical protein